MRKRDRVSTGILAVATLCLCIMLGAACLDQGSQGTVADHPNSSTTQAHYLPVDAPLIRNWPPGLVAVVAGQPNGFSLVDQQGVRFGIQYAHPPASQNVRVVTTRDAKWIATSIRHRLSLLPRPEILEYAKSFRQTLRIT